MSNTMNYMDKLQSAVFKHIVYQVKYVLWKSARLFFVPFSDRRMLTSVSTVFRSLLICQTIEE